MINVSILNSRKVIFEGKVESVTLPGNLGVFEVLEFHKPTISLLKKGEIIINNLQTIVIEKGIARVFKDTVVVLLEK